jgi:proteasome lid subunit RPN8/RPN11
MEKILGHAKASEDREAIGLLIGGYMDQTLVIEDAIQGRGEIEEGHVVLTGEELAKIADDILSGRVKGNVVGWYHSHLGRGAFLSDVDISTQLKLQQFSQNIVSMVIDPLKGDFGFFFVDPVSHKPHRVSEDHIFEFNPGEGPVPHAPPQRPPARKTPPMKTIIIATILMALIGSSILFFLIYSSPQLEKPAVQIHPIPGAVVGEELEISADVKEGSIGLEAVTLSYRTKAQTEWIQVQMARRSGSTFFAKIPPSQMAGDLVYFISAKDKAGNVVESPLALVGLRSFDLVGTGTLAKLYSDSRSELRFEVIPMNGFSSEVSFEILGLPEGVGAEFAPASAIPQGGGPVGVSLKLSALGPSNPTPGEYKLSIKGIHGEFSRSIPAELLIPTFDLSIWPTSTTVIYGGVARFNVSISHRYGFDRELKFEVRGLPSDSFQAKLMVPSGAALSPGSTNLVLEVYVDTYARIGTYDFKLIAMGGGIEREASANLKVSRTRIQYIWIGG